MMSRCSSGVEQSLRKREVGGSIPSNGITQPHSIYKQANKKKPVLGSTG